MVRIKHRPSLASGLKLGPPEFTSVTATYTVLTSDEALLCDASGGAFTVTLPAVTDDVPPFYYIKNIGASGAVTIDTVDGGSYILASQYDAVTIATDGSNWYVFGRAVY